MTKKNKVSKSQKVKRKARRSLGKRKISKKKRKYVIDTSAIINKFLPKLIKKGLKGKIIIPNAVMSELENLANKGKEEGYRGLEEVSRIRKNPKVKVDFKGSRPSSKQIKYAKSGDIDAMIRKIADKENATLITCDLVQAKSAQAYGINVHFLKQRKKRKKKPKKKSFLKKIFKK